MKKFVKKSCLVLCLLFASTIIHAQTFTEKWVSCFGGTEWDEATGILFSDSSYWVVAQTRSNDGDVSFNHGSYDSWFTNVSLQGEFIKEKTFGGSYADALFTDIPT